MDQTQSRIGDERLAELAAWQPGGATDTLSAKREEWQKMARELTALRASHKRLVEALEEIERHHLEINRAAGRPVNRSRTLRMCAAAFADARKLEGK